MEQNATTSLGCGIGNYLSAEILYRAKISPRKKMIDIYHDKKIVYKLANKIKYTIKLAFLTANVGYLSHLDNSMSTWITKFRQRIKDDTTHKYHYHPDINIKNNIFNYDVYRQKKDPKGNPVIMDKILPNSSCRVALAQFSLLYALVL